MRAFQYKDIPRPELSIQIHQMLKLDSIDLEIGAGRGLHAVRYCEANPERPLLAIERTHNKFSALQGRKENHPLLKCLVPLQADAISVIAHFVRSNQLARIFLLYPNPNIKRKHAHLRWHNSPFMEVLHEKLKRGGTLTLATNFEWYAEEAKTQMTEQWGFELLSHQKLNQESIRPRTHFEKKYLARGEICHDLVFAKPASVCAKFESQSSL